MTDYFMEPPPEVASEPPTLYDGAVQAAKLLFEAEKHRGSRCNQGEALFWWPTRRAYGPGHVYSVAGRAEIGLTQTCEWHFDLWTCEPDDHTNPQRVIEEVQQHDRSDQNQDTATE